VYLQAKQGSQTTCVISRNLLFFAQALCSVHWRAVIDPEQHFVEKGSPLGMIQISAEEWQVLIGERLSPILSVSRLTVIYTLGIFDVKRIV
jgi:hypothetical protein